MQGQEIESERIDPSNNYGAENLEGKASPSQHQISHEFEIIINNSKDVFDEDFFGSSSTQQEKQEGKNNADQQTNTISTLSFP